MTDDFSAKTGVAVVTGGSGGLGSAVALMLAARGSDVAITYHANADAASKVVAGVEAHGRRARAWPLDLVDADATNEFLADAARHFDGIHTLVHAAGPFVPQIHLSRVEPAQFKQQVEEDVVAFFNLVQPVLPYLRESAGSVVAITTAATRRYPDPRRSLVGAEGCGRGGGAGDRGRGGALRRARQLRGAGHAHRRHGRPGSSCRVSSTRRHSR